jgi:hypothetical protein
LHGGAALSVLLRSRVTAFRLDFCFGSTAVAQTVLIAQSTRAARGLCQSTTMA